MNGISPVSMSTPSISGKKALLETGRSFAETTDALTDTGAVSAICSFSTESLEQLSSATQAGFIALEDAFSDASDAITDTWEAASTTASEWSADLSDLAEDGLETWVEISDALGDSIADVADAVAGSLGTAATQTGDELESVAGAVSTGAKNAASYLALGLHAAQATLSELA